MNAAYVTLALPLAGFLLLVWLGRKLGEPAAGWLTVVLAGGSFIASVIVWATMLSRPGSERHATLNIFSWIAVGGLRVNVALYVDPLSMTMALFVTGVGSLIFLYSIGYMHGDPDFPRFFLLVNLFLFSMLTLVLADNFLFNFLGWEGVAFCSYQLVSFWFERPKPPAAGKKAFITTRVGDFGFFIGMFLIFNHFRSLNYVEVFRPLTGAPGALAAGTATAIALLLFLGAVGKSAQLPLFIWLPDAMEGPTPVSALIHAATMVTAGVYLMCRIAPILHYAPDALTTIAVVGAVTAFFAATIACAQDDIKRVLAYSTVSQLGYMFMAIGSGGYSAAVFQMVSHAFFKALLFLGAGSVIHGMHDEQNMKRMGGLRRWMPITFVTFVIGWLAISGIPPLDGFWSKDAVLDAAWHKSPALWAAGFVTAGLTAYYMTRQVALVWFGKARWEEHRPAPAAAATAAAGHAEPDAATAPAAGVAAAPAEPEPAGTGPITTGTAHGGSAHGGGNPHESPWTMTVPLVSLAALTVVGGLLDLPFGHVLERWLEPVFPPAIAPDPHISAGLTVVLDAVTLVIALVAILVAFRPWATRAERPELEPAVLQNGYYYDAAVSAFVAGPGTEMFEFTADDVDHGVIDGAVNGVAWLTRQTGGLLRKLQTGYVRNYALGIAGGAAAILLYVAFRSGG
jgi:NADH-quinone oxidoreductase subunit L